MYLPSLMDPRSESAKKIKVDSTIAFTGLNQTNTCNSTEMKSMHNMSLREYPGLTARQTRRLINLNAPNIKGIIGGENLRLVSTDGIRTIYPNGRVEMLTASFSDTDKTLVRMGNNLCIFPDKKVFDGSFVKNMEETFTSDNVTFTLTNAKGEVITYHDAAWYQEHDAADGMYLLTEEDGKSVLKQYAITTDTWVTITTAYVMASAEGIGGKFEAFDGLKISLDLNGQTWAEVDKILPNEEEGVHFGVFPVKAVSPNAITFAGILSQTKTLTDVTFTVKRETPDIAFVTEAGNRLWGCNKEGTEVYATKLGDPLNWNCFEGISTDSWAATIGSDGEFTGAVTYLGYPTFFKENSLLKIAISSSGSHQTKETVCRGVQKGCSDSLCVVNEVLYFKSQTSICSYDGSLPQTISTKLGEVTRFTRALGGRNKDCYYILCENGNDRHMYVFDTTYGMWVEDDNVPYRMFTTVGNVLAGVYGKDVYLLDMGANILSFPEDTTDVEWHCETAPIDYNTTDAKYIHKVIIKAFMAARAKASVWISYDGGKYERLFEMKATGTTVYPLSIVPRRCDRFALRIEGKGSVTIKQIVKTYETGSDIY